MISVSVIIGFTIGNFFYQFITNKDYERAFKISFYQAIAIGLVAFLEAL